MCADETDQTLTEQQLKQEISALKTTVLQLRKQLSKAKKKSGKPPSRKDRLSFLRKEIYYFLPPSCADFIVSQLQCIKKKKTGRRWGESDKATALTLFHSSPKAYRILKSIFVLPSVSTLRRSMRQVSIYPGFNAHILDALKLQVSSMAESSSLCAIVLDEMSIKENVSYNKERDEVEGFEDFGTGGRTKYIANHATVFMVRGLVDKWKQAVGYFLTSGTMDSDMMHTLLLECIDKAEEAGLTVKVVIGDQGSNNRKMFDKGLKATETEPFFFHRGKKIFVLHDPPHLLKNIRNNFKKSGFLIDSCDISWLFVEEFYEFDQKNCVRLAPKLKKKHVTLPPFSNLKVSLAAQVLSHSVAAGISTLVQLGVFPLVGKVTASFIERFDRLFNAFNSGKMNSSMRMRHAMSTSSGHREFLTDTLEWLNKLQTPSGRALPCLSGWRMAIHVLIGLFDDLHTNHGISFLLTNRLNQDCVENLFSVIRGKGGHRDNPSAQQFRYALRQVMVDRFFVQSDGSNCSADGDKFLLTLTSVMASTPDQPAPLPTEPEVLPFDERDSLLAFIAIPGPRERDASLVLAEKNVLLYIAGYIAKKVTQKVCGECKTVLTGTLTGSDAEIFFSNKQYYDLQSAGLVIPSAELTAVVRKLEACFQLQVCKVLHMDKVRYRLNVFLHKELSHASLVCTLGTCSLKNLVVDLFINIHLYSTLRDNSSMFVEQTGKRNRKMIKLSHV